jgi:hypothetical protein
MDAEVRAMIHPTVIQRSRYDARVATQSADVAFPLTFLALAFGVIAGVGIAGVVIPAVLQVMIPAIVRIVTGA